MTIVVLVLFIVAMLVGAQFIGKTIRLTDLVDLRTEEQKAVVQESEEDIERIAAFVTHSTCVTNNRACAGSDVEWLTTCTFLGSQKFTGVSNTVNFRQAYPLAPYTDRPPYKLKSPDTAPYYKLRLSGFADTFFDSVLESIERSGHWNSYKRIREQVVIPFLERSVNAPSFPVRFKELCGRLVKLTRSQLAKLEGNCLTCRGWPENKIVQQDMLKAGFVELVRITDKDAQSSQKPGRVYGDPFIFYGRP